MPMLIEFAILLVAGWLNSCQRTLIEYLKEENRYLRSRLDAKALRFNDRERRRLARLGKVVGRRALSEIGCLVHPTRSCAGIGS